MSIAEKILPFVKDENRYIQSLRSLFKEYLNNFNTIDINALNNFISVGLLVICSKELREDLTTKETEIISEFFRKLFITPLSLYSIQNYENDNKYAKFVKNIIKESVNQYQDITDYQKAFLKNLQINQIFPYSKLLNKECKDLKEYNNLENESGQTKKKEKQSRLYSLFSSRKKKEEALFLDFIHSDIIEKLETLSNASSSSHTMSLKHQNSFDTMNNIYEYYKGYRPFSASLVESFIYYIMNKNSSPIVEVLPISIQSFDSGNSSISRLMYTLISELKKRENTHALMDSLLNNHLINGERYNHLRMISYEHVINDPSADMIQDKIQM